MLKWKYVRDALHCCRFMREEKDRSKNHSWISIWFVCVCFWRFLYVCGYSENAITSLMRIHERNFFLFLFFVFEIRIFQFFGILSFDFIKFLNFKCSNRLQILPPNTNWRKNSRKMKNLFLSNCGPYRVTLIQTTVEKKRGKNFNEENSGMDNNVERHFSLNSTLLAKFQWEKNRYVPQLRLRSPMGVLDESAEQFHSVRTKTF